MKSIFSNGLWRSALMATALLGIPACGSDGPTSPNSGGKVTGTWVLDAVDDEEPPVAIHQGAYLDPNTGVFFNNFVYRISSGYIEVRENETFFLVFQIQVQADGQAGGGSIEMEGEWDLVDDEVVLRIQLPFVETMTMAREDGMLHADIDFLGLGEETHLHFKK